MNNARAIALLQDMLGISSLSGQEAAHARFLTAQMHGLGFTKSYVDEAGNAVGEMGEAGAARTVVLLGHQDTVPGSIAVRIEQGRLYGRGSVDAKGPLAAFVAAVAATGPLPGIRLVVVGAVEEEAATSKGALAVRERFRGADTPLACIIGEPSGWDRLTLGYKGRLLADLRIAGPCGHSAGDRLGVNERAVTWWQSILDYAKRRNLGIDSPFLQLLPSLRHINSGSDGLQEWADVRAGLRLPPDLQPDPLREDLLDLALRAAGDPEGITLHFSGYEPAYVADKNTPLVRACLAGIRQAGGRPGFLLKTGTSDMNVVGPAWQCPIVAYGPGDSSLDHAPDEHILLDDYLAAIKVLETALRRLAG